MNKKIFEKLIQDHLAKIVAGPSVLRNQGPKGMIKKARAYLKRIKLGKFKINCSSALGFEILETKINF